MQDRGFNSFASNMIKLSVNETKWSSLLARTRALILILRLEYLNSYRDFRDTGPWELVELTNKITVQIFTELFSYVDFWNQQESFLIYVWNATA